jgi:transcriptional regulator with XRE-family HTH domain
MENLMRKRNLFKWRRQCLGHTQLQLSNLSGVDQGTISRIENGHFVGVSVEAVRKVAAVLGVNAAWIFPNEKPAKEVTTDEEAARK